MTDPHELDVGKILATNARAAAREQKIRWSDRRVLWIFVFVVVMCLLVGWYGQEATNGLRHKIEKRLCVVLVPLLPKTPQEVPNNGYGKRVLSGVHEGAKENHCVIPKTPR